MNKGALIRSGIVFGIFVVILVVFAVIGSAKDRNDASSLPNSDEVYLTVGDITLTKQELWDKIRLTEGVSYLETYIEENYLLSTEISKVTQAEVDELVEFYVYGTNDQDDINEIKEDAELEADLIEKYESSLKILGYDPSNPADVKKFMQLEIAKSKFAYEAVLAAEDTDDIALSDYELQTYFDKHNKGEVCALNVVFNSTNEAKAVFEKLNLVPNFNQGWGEYTESATVAYKDVSDFTEDNTKELIDEEVFAKFIAMYNEMNENDPLNTALTLSTFCAAATEEFKYDYQEMIEDRRTGDPYIVLADYIFDTLGVTEDDPRFSFTLQELGEFQVLSYKVAQTGKETYYVTNPAYDKEDADADEDYDIPEFIVDLTDAEIEAVKIAILEQTFQDSNAKKQLLIEATELLWSEEEFEIFDPIMKVKYTERTGEKFDNKGSKNYIAMFNGTEITAETLYDYTEAFVGTYYSIDLIKNKALLQSDTYTELYEDDRDYIDSNRQEFVDFRDALRGIKNNFLGGQFAQNGYDPSLYSWDEFMLIAFYAKDEAEAIENFYIINTLQPYFVVDSVDYSAAAAVVQKDIDNYFNLDATHLLVYVDFDQDFAPDEYNDFVDGLDAAELVQYNTYKTEIKQMIEERLNDETEDYDFADIVAEFNDGLATDTENEWAKYKEYGFRMLTQDLSSQTSLTHENTDFYDEAFVVALKDLYDDYVAINAASAEDKDELYYDELFQSNFGLHYLYATEGDVFDLPTGEYSETDDEQMQYPEDANHDEVVPSQAQVDLYIEIKFAEAAGTATDASLPKSVYDAIEAYFGETYNAYFSATGYTIATINYMLENTPTYGTDSAARITYLNTVLDIMYNSNFDEDFVRPE